MPKETMREERLARVIYRSHSRLPDTVDERTPAVTEILRVARRNNAETGLTGVLVFDGDNFLQAIEGDIGLVEDVYENIARDLRHENIELIEFKAIARRNYRTSPMAYVEGLSAERDTLRHLLAALSASHPPPPDDDAVSALS